MAGSSTPWKPSPGSPGAPQQPYDVFLCHRGPDTKRDFCTFLARELRRQRLAVFFDQRSLEPGDDAPAVMAAAMRTARLGIVVLSRRFFASGDCMQELEVFLDRSCVLPLLVGLRASDVDGERIVARRGVWSEPGCDGGPLWECYGGDEAVWRRDVARVAAVTMDKLSDHGGNWDLCIDEAVRSACERLGRPPPTPTTIDTTPFPCNVEFLGRTPRLESLHELLACHGRAAICGLPGIGKTQLALEYVHQHRRGYSRILWLDASGSRLAAAFLGLAKPLGVKLAQGPEEEGAAHMADGDLCLQPPLPGCDTERRNVEAVRRALEGDGGPTLLVLDNLERDNAVMAEVLPTGEACHILITTRLSGVSNFAELPLDMLAHRDAMALLLGHEELGGEELEAAEDLAGRLGYLTLSLAFCRRQLAHGAMLPSHLLQRLQAEGSQTFSAEPGDPVFRTHPDLVRLFDASIELLQCDEKSAPEHRELAIDMAHAAGWFAGVPIPVPLLAQAAALLPSIRRTLQPSAPPESNRVQDRPRRQEGTMQGEASRQGPGRPHSQFEAAVDRQKPAAVDEAVRLLVHYGMARRAKCDSSLIFHLLVQEYGNAKGGTEAGTAMVASLCTSSACVDTHPEHCHHAIRAALGSHSQEPALALSEDLLARFVEGPALRLVNHLGFVLRRYSDALHLADRLAWTAEHRLHALPAVCASVFDRRSWVLGVLGRYTEAEQLSRRALKLRRKLQTTEKSTQLVCQSLMMLASHLRSNGKYVEAEEACREALEIRELRFGKQHSLVATTLNLLAELCHNQGKHSEAEDLALRSLSIRQATSSRSSRLYCATPLGRLAIVLETVGRHAEAERYARESLAIRQEFLSPRRPETAICLTTLAATLASQGRLAEAEARAREARRISEDANGVGHPVTTFALEGLANVLKLLGQPFFAEAEDLFCQVVEIRQAKLGGEHSLTATAYRDHADLLIRVGELRWTQAEQLLRSALRVQRSTPAAASPGDLQLARTLAKLAELYLEQQRFEEAEPLLRESISITEQVLGSMHAETQHLYEALRRSLQGQESYVEEESIIRSILQIQAEERGHRNACSSRLFVRLGSLMTGDGRLRKALEEMSVVLEAKRAELGTQHSDVKSLARKVGALWRLQLLSAASMRKSKDSCFHFPDPLITTSDFSYPAHTCI